MIRFAFIPMLVSAVAALQPGELHFNLSGRTYHTQHAVAMLKPKGDTTRLMIAVKDVEQRFLLVLTADVPKGDETKPLHLTSENAELAINLRTPQGVMAVMPQVQLAKPTTDAYWERVEIETDQWEDDPEQSAMHEQRLGKKHRQRRKKIAQYRRVAPQWHHLTREQRMQSGQGIIHNRAFQDTYFTLTLTPVKQAQRVTAYHGTFSGTGRFTRSASGAEIRPIQNGAFYVRVEYAP